MLLLVRLLLLCSPAHCQAVWLPADGHANDAYGEVQVAHHAADEAPLLVVLLAKHGYVRLHNVEQLRHNLGVARPDNKNLHNAQRTAKIKNVSTTVTPKPPNTAMHSSSSQGVCIEAAETPELQKHEIIDLGIVFSTAQQQQRSAPWPPL